eukprot:TRINITY_DN46948_c0_g1_i1.p1 TRINITY_DN46948_c0_g1~~TRINITY_DN46948_c0_g1_i1.p1  ORF type:complete len:424 (-),score=92.06 TRINITY_DN46948_c0_g1_i1:187-1458(-)
MVGSRFFSRQPLPAGVPSEACTGPVLVGPTPRQLQQMSTALSTVVEEASRLLNEMTEDDLSNTIEAAIKSVAAAIQRFEKEIPTSKVGCATALDALKKAVEKGRAPQNLQSMNSQELLCAFHKVKVLCRDLQDALEDVSREEIEELSGVGLTVARMACATAQTNAQRLHDYAHPQHTVIIEDLEENSDPDAKAGGAEEGDSVASFSTRASDSRFCRGSFEPRVELLRSRYLWRPLWPRLRKWARSPSVPTPATRLCARAQERPLTALAVVTVSWPAALGTSVAAACALPWALVGDCVLQRLYAARRQRVDDSVEASLQVGKLMYLSSRLATRKFLKMLKIQFTRCMGGREPAQVLRDTADAVRQDPFGSLRKAASVGYTCGRDVFRAGRESLRRECSEEWQIWKEQASRYWSGSASKAASTAA